MMLIVTNSILLFYLLGIVFKNIRESCAMDFLGREETTALRGVMTILIVFSHVASRLLLMDSLNIYLRLVAKIIAGFGSLGVGTFFFLSGYGNFLSLQKIKQGQGTGWKAYSNWIVKRFANVLIPFVICLVLDTIVLNTCNSEITSRDFLRCFVTLTIPNTTTWYIKIQLFYYFIISVLFCFLNNKKQILCVMFIISVLVSFLFFIFKSTWWNGNTGLCFFMGMLFATKNIRFSRNKLLIFWGIIILCIIWPFICVKDIGFLQFFVYPIVICSIVYFGYKYKIKSKILQKIGSNSLEIYLIHIGLVKVLLQTYSNKAYLLFLIVLWILSFLTAYTQKKLNKQLIAQWNLFK